MLKDIGANALKSSPIKVMFTFAVGSLGRPTNLPICTVGQYRNFVSSPAATQDNTGISFQVRLQRMLLQDSSIQFSSVQVF